MDSKTIQEKLKEVSLAYAEGASDAEICKILTITQNRFDKLYADEEGFRKMIDVGRMMSKAYWYEMARKNLYNKQFNTGLWTFVMKNRFGWAEKAENYEKSDIPTDQQSLDELRGRLLKMGPSVLKTIFPDKTESEIMMMEGDSGTVN